jgi:hypothetical protein
MTPLEPDRLADWGARLISTADDEVTDGLSLTNDNPPSTATTTTAADDGVSSSPVRTGATTPPPASTPVVALPSISTEMTQLQPERQHEVTDGPIIFRLGIIPSFSDSPTFLVAVNLVISSAGPLSFPPLVPDYCDGVRFRDERNLHCCW